MELEKRVDQSIKLLRAYNRFCNLTLAYSGGKDSDVCLRLCKLAHIKVDIVYNNTTIDPPYTLSRNKSIGALISQPRYTFYQLVAKKGLPSMFRRFCCSELKERYIAKHLILGIRREESVKRSVRYQEPSACYIYTKSKSTEQILPILYFTDTHIQQFIELENIPLHPLYYNNQGKVDCSRRLGCIGCPLLGDRGISDYLRYPKALRQLAISYKHFVDTHKSIEGIYEDITWNLFYSNHKDHNYQQTYHGLFQPPSARQFLQEFFKVELPDFEKI